MGLLSGSAPNRAPELHSVQPGSLRDKPGAWVDLGLTLPIFLGYHLGVVFLKVRNGTDLVTGELLSLANGDTGVYLGETALIALVFAGVFAIAGRGQAFRPKKFVQIAIEGAVYASLMALGPSWIVGHIFAAGNATAMTSQGPFVGTVMSLGAGFYEELTFRVLLFGLGAKLLVWLFAKQTVGLTSQTAQAGFSFRAFTVMLAWGVVCAALFSGMHYIGSLGDPFELPSFTFRLLLGVVLTLIYVTRGFAAAVWAHAIYDLWILVLR
jgi:hypothetical protein